MPASTKAKPTAGPDLPEDVAEVLNDALDSRHKSAESYAQDVKEAFQVLPKENIEAAAAVLHDMANEAMKNQRYDEAAEHYTSVLAAHPHDHEVLANRSLAYLHLKRGPEALNDAALCVNLKPNWAKGYYRMGCALEECKAYKESASVFAKVVEMEPENAEASGRLMKARQMLEMVMNVERVNDPLWMHKPPPPKSEVQQRAEEAQEKSTAAVTAVWEEMGALRPLSVPRRCLRAALVVTPPPLSHARQASVRLTSS
jgi:tetratricopeptide (TPR) repeat protein